MAFEATNFSRAQARSAVFWLIVATVFWGAGFTWAKAAQRSLRESGVPAGAALILFLAVRFSLAAIIWTAVLPAARRGWSGASLIRAAILGGLLGGGLVLQHFALDRSSEAVTAFLTALSVVFVPLLSSTFLRQPPPRVVWLGVAVALVGVWQMTGAAARDFNHGTTLGVACAIVFSFHLLALNRLQPRDSPFRLIGGQLIVVAVFCWLLLAAQPGPIEIRRWSAAMLQTSVLVNLALLIAMPTLGAFSLMVFFQPRIDASRAALIYLIEPIAAGAFAFIAAGARMSASELVGAALILVANSVVEIVLSMRSRSTRPR